MKKITAILLSALLALSLAACGENNQNTQEDTPSETADPATEPTDGGTESTDASDTTGTGDGIF